MALAENPEQYRSIASVFEEQCGRKLKLEQELAAPGNQSRQNYDPDAEVKAALAVLDRLPDLVDNDGNLAKIGEAFRLVNVRVFLRFQKLPVKKRVLNKLAGGSVTFGDAPPPIALYAGPTGRRATSMNHAAMVAADSGEPMFRPNQIVSGEKGNSLGNVSRGDRI